MRENLRYQTQLIGTYHDFKCPSGTKLNRMCFMGSGLIRGAADLEDREPPEYDRDKLRYRSDLTDAEWEHIA